MFSEGCSGLVLAQLVLVINMKNLTIVDPIVLAIISLVPIISIQARALTIHFFFLMRTS